MTPAREAVQRALRRARPRLPGLFAPNTLLVVAFSGGQDSTCLLHALCSQPRTWRIVAAHVDHGLRAESAAAAERVALLARAIGAEIVIRRVDIASYRRPGWSIQQAARAARYQALAAVVSEHGANALVVGHTADDQAETVLLNLLRGTGLGGLAGMRMDETMDLSRFGPPGPLVADRQLRLARPLLRVSRATTFAYCAELGLQVVEDPSNQSRAYTRNRVRLDLLPALERFNPAIREVLARTADLAAEDLDALDAIVSALHEQTTRTRTADSIGYDLAGWQAHPRGLQRRLLRFGIKELVGALVDVPTSPIEDALDLLRSGSAGQAYHLPYGVELRIAHDTFSLRLHGAAQAKRYANIGESVDSRV